MTGAGDRVVEKINMIVGLFVEITIVMKVFPKTLTGMLGGGLEVDIPIRRGMMSELTDNIVFIWLLPVVLQLLLPLALLLFYVPLQVIRSLLAAGGGTSGGSMGKKPLQA